MATKRSVKRKLTEKIEKVSGIKNPIPGRVGASRTLIETGIAGLLWVRIEGSGQPYYAINTAGVPSEYNHPVILGRSKNNPKLFEIIASRQLYNVPVNRDLRYHHTQHEWPGPDTVFVRDAQFLPLLVLPYSGFIVQIFGGVITINGVRLTVNNQQVDLTSLVPASGAIWVLLEVDSTGAIDTVSSAAVDTKELLTPSLIPLPDANARELCAIRLYIGQEQIQRTLDTLNDIIDLRFGLPDGNTHAHDAADTTYTPAVLADWDYLSDPGDTADGLDQLAQRVTDLEVTPPGTWDGDITDLDETSSTDIGEAIADADQGILYNASASAWVRFAWSRVKTYIQALTDTLYAPIAKGVTNGDSHDHSGGDGAQIAYTSLSGTPAAENNANDLFNVSSAASAFAGTIATLPGGATLTYNVSSGNEGAMVPSSTSQLAKLRLYNTTRGTSALISNCVVGTNTLTLTANVPAGWQVGDTITIASQTVTGGAGNWVDLELTSGPTGKQALFCYVLISDTASANSVARIHPFEAYGGGKQQLIVTQAVGIGTTYLALIKLTNNVFTVSWIPAAAGTVTLTIREQGYLP